jgi:hypothetical protein
MKWTPQKTITSASVLAGLLRERERVTDEVGEILDLRILVVVRQKDRVLLALEAPDLGFQVERRVDAVGAAGQVELLAQAFGGRILGRPQEGQRLHGVL